MLERTKLNTLTDVFNQRAALTPQKIAYQYFDTHSSRWCSITWREVFKQTLNYRNALASENLTSRGRVLIILENCIDWVCLEQATLALGLIPVAVSPMDSLQTIRHIVQDSNPELIFIESDRLLQSLQLQNRYHCIIMRKLLPEPGDIIFANWLHNHKNFISRANSEIKAKDLATIIYTSGSSGKAKGVMLSHEAIINNAQACLETFSIVENDKLLCVTPLSHVMARVADYYLSMLTGTTIAFNRALGMMHESIKKTHPTLMLCTPYVIECAYNDVVTSNPLLGKYIEKYLEYSNGTGPWKISFLLWNWVKSSLRNHVKKDFLYSLRTIFVAGATLSPNTQRLAEILGLPIFQGYGLTEAGGMVSFNTQKNNHPASIGIPLANTMIKFDDSQQLLLHSNSLMLGYWGNNSENHFTPDGWLKTGDIGNTTEGFLYLDKRQSTVIQLVNGHCVYPELVEEKIREDGIFENVILYGESQNKLTAICQIIPEKWTEFLQTYRLAFNTESNEILANSKVKSILFTRVNALIQTIPEAPRIDFVLPAFENWSEIGLVNPQGKISRQQVAEFYQQQLYKLYHHQYPNYKPERQ